MSTNAQMSYAHQLAPRKLISEQRKHQYRFHAWFHAPQRM
jgi:hypothetical protein